MKMSRRLGWSFTAAWVCLFATSAAATENFPPLIASQLSAAEPSCTLCHNTPQGGSGTVSTLFGRAMLQRGLTPWDEDSLIAALAQMESEAVDSDGDGVGDVEEVRTGRSPNRGEPAGGSAGTGSEGVTTAEGVTADDVPPPSYGCAVGGGADLGAMGAVLSLAFCLEAWRRRRNFPR